MKRDGIIEKGKMESENKYEKRRKFKKNIPCCVVANNVHFLLTLGAVLFL